MKNLLPTGFTGFTVRSSSTGLILLLFVSCYESIFEFEDVSDQLSVLSQTQAAKYGKVGISDSANDGIDEFYFLAPTVEKSPKYRGEFHSTLNPIVEISDDFDFNNILASFKRGDVINKVIVNESDEYYSAIWNTADSKVTPGKIYRVRVRVGERVLGFVDVGIFTSMPKQVNTKLTPVVQNQSFRVTFRIEKKICPAKIVVSPAEAFISVDEVQQYQAVVFNYYDEVLEDVVVKWAVENGEVASIDQNGLAMGITVGQTQITAQAHDVIGVAGLTVRELGENEMGILFDPRDGQTYRTINIGGRIWMAENLNYEPFSQGCNHVADNDLDLTDCPTSGRYYHYHLGAYTACPDGWHLPTYDEWVEFGNTFGGWIVVPPKDGNTFMSYPLNPVTVDNIMSSPWYTTQAEAGRGGAWWSSTVYKSFDDFPDESRPSAYEEDNFGDAYIQFYHSFSLGGGIQDNDRDDDPKACRCIQDY